jgi:hypothetical protein
MPRTQSASPSSPDHCPERIEGCYVIAGKVQSLDKIWLRPDHSGVRKLIHQQTLFL